MVAERNEEVVGFMIYELHPKTLHVLNFAVHPDARRQGVGRAMVGKLTSKLTPSGRNTIVLEVRETNLIAQLCYRSLGFRAVRVIRDFYHDCNDDAYQMRYRRPTDKEETDMKT
jgi:ribosomal-protein-alanine N-acetyltransferase